MIPPFLKAWVAKFRRPYSPLRLTAGIGGAVGVVALLFWFQPNSGTLGGYKWSRSFRIPAIHKDLSGITYCSESATLFMVSNVPTAIYETTLEGHLLRRIKLDGFHDTEDIVFIEGHTFAVIEERRRTISTFQILPGTKTVFFDDCRHISVLPPDHDNTGLEGLAWDSDTRTFLVSKESNPRAVYKIPYGSGGDAQEIPALHNLPLVKLISYSGLYFEKDPRRVLILSRKSGKIRDYSLEGKEKGSLNLSLFIPGIIRAEGLTVLPGGELYVCSEPDRVDVFTRPREEMERAFAPLNQLIHIADNESGQSEFHTCE